MLKIIIALAALAAATNTSAQTPAPLPGVWAVGEPAACATGNAWVFFKEGFYAEVKLPDGPISSLGHWRDEGTALAYSHAHMPFTKLAEGQPERRMTFKARSADRFEATAPSGTLRVFSRCPEGTLKAPANAGAH
jgi:hypothetical protein